MPLIIETRYLCNTNCMLIYLVGLNYVLFVDDIPNQIALACYDPTTETRVQRNTKMGNIHHLQIQLLIWRLRARRIIRKSNIHTPSIKEAVLFN
ncbi:uncharacterized protein J3R85_008799 [Psidium guajava]|nr:uncharacterized protein J3R85_008799 [Psidium guajava]